MTIKKCQAEAAKGRKKLRCWLCVFYLSIASLVLCAVLAFVVRFATSAFLLPAVLAWCMFPLLLLVVVSISRWVYWSSRVEMQACFLDSLETDVRGKDMTRSEMIAFIKENPHTHISHPLFADDEYIYADSDGLVWSEDGRLFENWDSEANKWSGVNGIRLRQGGSWETGWYIKD